jgi:hypothetical protein
MNGQGKLNGRSRRSERVEAGRETPSAPRRVRLFIERYGRFLSEASAWQPDPVVQSSLPEPPSPTHAAAQVATEPANPVTPAANDSRQNQVEPPPPDDDGLIILEEVDAPPSHSRHALPVGEEILFID